MLAYERPAHAQSAIYESGDTVITGFSGIKPPEGDAPADGDPADSTFIDSDGASMTIFRAALPGEPRGEALDAPAIFKLNASDVGQVFAIALGDQRDEATPPDIYLGATSVFGLNIVVQQEDGYPVRTKAGAPNATWMYGQFGTDKGGGPGSIWRVDARTGDATLFANIEENSGPGIGDIVYDKATSQLFVSDLDTGLIQRIDSSGTILDSFDHGTMGRPAGGLDPLPDDGSVADTTSPSFESDNPATWGFTPRERMVWGMALHGGRLYYAVQGGPEVWSVGINLDGTFETDARLEFKVEGLGGDTHISDMLFDARGRLYLAQRGEFRGSYDYSVLADPQNSEVLRYGRDPKTGEWTPEPESYAIGFPEGFKNASGGIAIGACSTTLWTTGDNLRNNPAYADQLSADGPLDVHGLQANDIALVRPENEPPFKAVFVDYDGKSGDPEKAGHVGDVEVWQSCKGASGGEDYGEGYYIPPYGDLPPGYEPPRHDRFNLRLTKHARPHRCIRAGAGWNCRYVIRVRNTGPSPYLGPIRVHDVLPGLMPGSTVTFLPQPPWNCSALAPNEFNCVHPPVFLTPGLGVDLVVRVHLPHTPRSCRVRNVGALKWAPGWGDANPGDDHDAAIAYIPVEQCRHPRERTNLKLEKRSNGDCARRPDGFHCSYTIRVTNTGPGHYDGPIVVQDHVPPGTVHIFPDPNWTCVGGPPTYTCSHAPVSLDPGQGRNLHFVVRVSPAAARHLQCQIRNHARITQAPGGTLQNINPGDDHDMAQAEIPVLCDQPDPPVVVLQPPHLRCPLGMWRSHGHCCPYGTRWDGHRCRRQIRPTCPPGTVGRPPRCRIVERHCPPGTVGKFPHCRKIERHCPPGMVGKPPHCRKIVRRCPPGMIGKPPHCRKIRPTCPPGTVGKPPHCRKVVRHCPPGMVGKPPHCRKIMRRCPPGMIGKPPHCRKVARHCPPGMVGKPPHCRKIRPTCPPGMVGKPPHCRKVVRHCPPGMVGKPPHCRPNVLRLHRERRPARQLNRVPVRRFNHQPVQRLR